MWVAAALLDKQSEEWLTRDLTSAMRNNYTRKERTESPPPCRFPLPYFKKEVKFKRIWLAGLRLRRWLRAADAKTSCSKHLTAILIYKCVCPTSSRSKSFLVPSKERFYNYKVILGLFVWDKKQINKKTRFWFLFTFPKLLQQLIPAFGFKLLQPGS